jgi:hypothetical protein
MFKCIDGNGLHHAIGRFCDEFRSGGIDRRESLRTLAWLGVLRALT